ncbi:MAG: SdrD B-like domain-containing protein, partial [Chloroflexales bacterium]
MPSNQVSVTARAQPKAYADKTLLTGGTPGVPTTYQVSVCMPSGSKSGGLNLSSIVIKDALPTGTTFVSASDGGTELGGVVTWPAATLAVSKDVTCVKRTVTVLFPKADFSIGNQVRNDVSATATAVGGVPVSVSAYDIRPLQPPMPGIGFEKKVAPSSALVGDTVTYSFNLQNSGTTSLSDVTVTDPIPSQLRVTKIIAGGHNLAATLRLRVEYQTNLSGAYAELAASPFTAAACVNVAPATDSSCATSITLGDGEYITALRYTYLDPLPFGFTSTSGNRSGFSATITSTPINDIIVNDATSSYTYNSLVSTGLSEATTRVLSVAARPSVKKTASTSVARAGDTISYTLQLDNSILGPSTPDLGEPMLVDLLNPLLTYVPGSAEIIHKPAGAPAPVFEQVANYNGTGKVLLRWRWDGAATYSLPAGQYLSVAFKARISERSPAGAISNTASLASWSTPAAQVSLSDCKAQSADTSDLDGDGNTTETICSGDAANVSLAAAASMDSLALVMGQLDGTWSHAGHTTPGGLADYQATITNTSNIAITNLVMVDILPWVGDVGVVRFDEARGSAWSPYLVGPLSAPTGAVVYYSTQNNPCRTIDLGISPDADSPSCTTPDWSTAPPADITGVRSVKIDFGDLVLQPKDSIVLTWPMRAPVGGTYGSLAWNSFGYRARPVGAVDYLIASEPQQVGIERQAPAPPAYGDYVWNDQNLNGLQDSSEPGVNGARVDFFRDSDGTPGPSAGDTFMGYTMTGPDVDGNPGFYLFSDPPRIPPGNYYAKFTPPAGYDLTSANLGDDTIDSDVDQASHYTEVTTLDYGEIDPTWDAGLVQSAAVGNYVWIDANGNGLQDEPTANGVNGIAVRLYSAGADDAIGGGDDTLVQSTVTANDPSGRPGAYLFKQLTPDTPYYVEFTPPSGVSFTTAASGSDASIDSDADQTTGQTSVFMLTSNQLDLSRDAGLSVPVGTLWLGDRVWYDLNMNGIYEPSAGEVGIDGVTLSLYRDVSNLGRPDAGEYIAGATTRTDKGIAGAYLFSSLATGNYIVVIDPSNFAYGGPLYGMTTSTGNDPAPDPNNNVDNDDNGRLTDGLLSSAPVTLSTSGNLTVDFGLFQTSSLGDKVWMDLNGDGTQGAAEIGVPGVTVELLDTSGTSVLGTTSTNASGIYGFTGLISGTYRIRFSGLPTGYTFTTANSGADSAADSDADPATGETAPITLDANSADITWDAGLVATPASIGDRVWDDVNSNGIQDSGEVGIDGVPVQLYRSNGTQWGSTITTATILGETGVYSFTNLPPGDYYLRFPTLPTGYTISPQGQGADDALDSDVDLTSRRTATTTLAPGENDLSWDLGLFSSASIGDWVWSDTNNNGIQDSGEPGVAGVGVRLYRPGNNTVVASVKTDSSGFYRFTNLSIGDYYVEFDLPSNYRPSPQNQGDDTKDSDADPLSHQTATTSLTPGESDTSWDFGIFPTASIGDRAWLDLNADGIQDSTETAGVPGVQVVLYKSDDTQIDTVVTDAGGSYKFKGLDAGDYYLRFIMPASFLLSPQGQGTNGAKDSDVAPITLQTAVTTLSAGESDTSWDIGLYQPASLGDFVWYDKNANGVQDIGEPGIDGVDVTLRGLGADNSAYTADDTTIAITTTATLGGGAGSYSFTNLPPGNYYIEFGTTPGYSYISPKDAEAATSITNSDANPATRRTDAFFLAASTSDLSWDMGVYDVATIGDRVWLDTNVDGVQSDGEPGVRGITVTLYLDTSTLVGTTTTDSNGAYSFTNLQPGSYYLIFSGLPTDYNFTRQNIGSDDAKDSDVNAISGQTGFITLESGQNDTTSDVGIYPMIKVGDRAWRDTNANGIQDLGEPGMPGVLVELYKGASLIDYTYTAADGTYLFTSLFPDSYHIVFTMAGYLSSPQNIGTDDTIDNDADTSFTTADFVPSSINDMTHDLGLYQQASLGDFVWHDQNANGVQDAGEPGIAGATVTLYSAGADHAYGGGDDVQVGDSTTTSTDGAYSFTGLTPGFYYVQFSLPSGFDSASMAGQGADRAKDSDASPTSLRTTTTELQSGESDTSRDAGFYKLASIGNFVWRDTNGDGVQSSGEAGIGGVTVSLSGTDGAGAAVALTTTTAISGTYSFSGLVPGSYAVTVSKPTGEAFTYRDITSAEVAGTTDAVDSDANDSGVMAATTLTSGESDSSWAAGLVILSSIGNFVWHDTNANGLQDDGATGIQGVTVTLAGAGRDRAFGTGDDTAASTTTDADGSYSFAGLQPGLYRVTVARPVAYDRFSAQNKGTDDTVDSDVPPGAGTSGTTATITLPSGTTDTTADAGLYQLASIGDRVW